MFDQIERALSKIEAKKGQCVLIALVIGILLGLVLVLNGLVDIHTLLIGCVGLALVLPISVIIKIALGLMDGKFPHVIWSRFIGAGMGMLWSSLVMLVASIYVSKTRDTTVFEIAAIATIAGYAIFNFLANNYKNVETTIATIFPMAKIKSSEAESNEVKTKKNV